MEGEQKVDLPLDGELDIKSSDMLVPVSQAKFAHNRQRWQGHVLPSSLRYEHDGWAAGWDVYNLQYSDKRIHVKQAVVMYKVRRYYYTENSYKFILFDNDDTVVASFVYNTITGVVSTDVGNVHIEREQGVDNSYIVSFYTPGHDTEQGITFKYNTITDTVSDISVDGIIVNAAMSENCNATFTINDTTAELQLYVNNLTLPSNAHARLYQSEEIVLGTFTPYVGGNTYEWSGLTYKLVCNRNGDKCTFDLYYDGVKIEPFTSQYTYNFNNGNILAGGSKYGPVFGIKGDIRSKITAVANTPSYVKANCTDMILAKRPISTFRDYNTTKLIEPPSHPIDYAGYGHSSTVMWKFDNGVFTAKLPVVISGSCLIRGNRSRAEVLDLHIYEQDTEVTDLGMYEYNLDVSNGTLFIKGHTTALSTATISITNAYGDWTSSPLAISTSPDWLSKGTVKRWQSGDFSTDAQVFIAFSIAVVDGVICQKMTVNNGEYTFTPYTVPGTEDEEISYIDRGNRNLFEISLDNITMPTGAVNSTFVDTIHIDDLTFRIVPKAESYSFLLLQDDSSILQAALGNIRAFSAFDTTEVLNSTMFRYTVNKNVTVTSQLDKDEDGQYIIPTAEELPSVAPMYDARYLLYGKASFDVMIFNGPNTATIDLDYSSPMDMHNPLVVDVLRDVYNKTQIELFTPQLLTIAGKEYVAQKMFIRISGIADDPTDKAMWTYIVYDGANMLFSYSGTSVDSTMSLGIMMPGKDVSVMYYLSFNSSSDLTKVVIDTRVSATGTINLIGPLSVPYIADEPFTVTKASDNSITFTDDINTYDYDVNSNTITIPSKPDVLINDVVYVSTGSYSGRLTAKYTPRYFIDATFDAICLTENIAKTSIEGDNVKIWLNSTPYESFDLILSKESMEAVSNDNHMITTATNITDPNCAEHVIDSTVSDAEFQVVKQFWNTTEEIEKYWWLAEDRVLILDRHAFHLYKNTKELDPWNGNKWERVYTIDRTTILDSEDIVTFVPNSYNSTAYAPLVIMSAADTKTISCKVITFTDRNYAVKTNTIDIAAHRLGTELVPRYGLLTDFRKLHTYTKLQARLVLSQSRISGTFIKDRLILGIHYDNNFNQWAVVHKTDYTVDYTIQGYGFVGVDGSLTGGEIPYKYFGSRGFSGIVRDINTLSKSNDDLTDSDYIKTLAELHSIDSKVVGNDDQQWYIDTCIDSIVSHLTCSVTDTGVKFTPVKLHINNNYDTVYESGSFAAQVLGDAGEINVTKLSELLGINTKGSITITDMLRTLSNTVAANDVNNASINAEGNLYNDNLEDAFNEGAGTNAGKKRIEKFKKIYLNTHLLDIDNFDIFNISPIMSNINYLQQTIGQYAYVHYNSSNAIPKSEPRSLVRSMQNAVSEAAGQEALINSLANDKLLSPVMSDELAFDTQVVKQVQSCDAEWPAAYLIILSIAMSALDVVQSKLQVNNSSNQVALAGMNNATQLYSLAMNSLAMSDLQTQKIIPTQVSEVTAVKTLDMFYSTSGAQKVYAGPGFVNHNFVAQCIAQSITSTQIELKQQKIQWIIKLLTEGKAMILSKIFEKCEEAVHIMCDAFSGSYLIVEIAFSMLGISFSLLHALWAGKLDIMDNILNGLGGDQPRVSLTAALSKHTYDIEGKHKYGNSSKSFMWPCFDCNSQDAYPDEMVTAAAQNKAWTLNTPTSKQNDVTVLSSILPNMSQGKSSFVTFRPDTNGIRKFDMEMPYFVAMCKGDSVERAAPNNMAYVIGTEAFLSKNKFKNETIGQDAPVFSAPLTQDYMLSASWQLGVTATAGEVAWVSVKDTKVIDGAPSNIVITKDFCGIASSYTAIEVKRGLDEKYMRPVTVTPNVLQLNCTGNNCIYNEKMYHGFDGYGGRIIKWVGAAGMNKEYYTTLYAFVANDRLKRSNKLAPNQFLGNFKSDPTLSMDMYGDDKIFVQVSQPSELKGMSAGTAGEDKDVLRYAIPVHTEYLSTLPAAVKTLSSYTLAVVDGVTSLCTDIRNTQTEYKSPISVDFNIGAQLYRATQEYICKITDDKGAEVVENLVPILGLTYLGASPYEAYFYSQATRQYYVYAGGTDIKAVDTIERFRDVKNGYWDFVNQEVVMPCVATFDRLDDSVHDDADETDNIIIPVIKNGAYRGEVPPPVTTIFDTKSWFKTYSLPSGVVFQGPKRCIINRFVWSDYMLPTVLDNRGKWKKVPREDYHPFRQYNKNNLVKGWTHNPFLLVTSPLGVNEETDCKFEWEITFAWTVEMDKLYSEDNYACVNVIAETMEPGGKVYSRPAHIYLTKDLFTRTGNYGYYSFRYQSNNGIGNRERLHIWADSYIAVSSVQCAYVEKTTRRTEILTQQVDIKGLKEM